MVDTVEGFGGSVLKMKYTTWNQEWKSEELVCHNLKDGVQSDGKEARMLPQSRQRGSHGCHAFDTNTQRLLKRQPKAI